MSSQHAAARDEWADLNDEGRSDKHKDPDGSHDSYNDENSFNSQ